MTGAGAATPRGLRQRFALEHIDHNLFRGFVGREVIARVVGGEVAGQALLAAGRTSPAHHVVHSTHAYFLRPADPGMPIIYRVEHAHGGGAITSRRVLAVQRGETVLTMTASFQRPEIGLDEQIPRIGSLSPADLPVAPTTMTAAGEVWDWFAGLSLHFPLERRGAHLPAPGRIWVRAAEALPEDLLLHSCALRYASELLLFSRPATEAGTALHDPDLEDTNLDHTIWMHLPARADDWLRYDRETVWAGGGRALCRGQMFDRAGTLVATALQERLVRLRSS